MTPRITVVTPALPGRLRFLMRAADSVARQTLPPAAHLVGVDHERRGSAAVRNQLALAAETEWVALLDDDDYLYPQHLERLGQHVEEADVVYSWCDVEGRDWDPNSRFDPDRLYRENYIPITTLIRTELVRKLGGWRDSSQVTHGFEDWDFWKRALDDGAVFRCVPERTWAYCFHMGNKTYHGERGAI